MHAQLDDVRAYKKYHVRTTRLACSRSPITHFCIDHPLSGISSDVNMVNYCARKETTSERIVNTVGAATIF